MEHLNLSTRITPVMYEQALDGAIGTTVLSMATTKTYEHIASTEHTQEMLTHDDSIWLQKIGVSPEKDIDELNKLIVLGSKSLHDQDDYSETRSAIIKARQDFFAACGAINTKAILAISARTETLIPLDTFVDSQRVMSEYGIDAVKVINASPAVIGYAPESVRIKMYALAKAELYNPFDIDGSKIIESNDPFQGKKFIDRFFTLPTESLLLYLASNPDIKDAGRVPHEAAQYAQALGLRSAKDRKEAYLQPRTFRETNRQLGYVATMNLLRLKVAPADIIQEYL